jgi:hypothetical protein
VDEVIFSTEMFIDKLDIGESSCINDTNEIIS